MYNNLSYADTKRALVRDINRWVNHCDMVWKRSAFKNYTTARTLDKISMVKNRVVEINTMQGLYNICLKIWALKKQLSEILPHPLNNSYESSLADLTTMVSFCNDYLIEKNEAEAVRMKPLTLTEKLKNTSCQLSANS